MEEREYTVAWTIQVSAASHRDAADWCWHEFFMTDHTASVFEVQPSFTDEPVVTIDMSKEGG